MSEVAQTIYEQLGGNRFKTVTGSKNFVSDVDWLSFKFPRSKAMNYCKIVLENDLYNIEFGNIHGAKYTIKREIMRVYASDLTKLFESTTGLYTSL